MSAASLARRRARRAAHFATLAAVERAGEALAAEARARVEREALAALRAGRDAAEAARLAAQREHAAALSPRARRRYLRRHPGAAR